MSPRQEFPHATSQWPLCKDNLMEISQLGYPPSQKGVILEQKGAKQIIWIGDNDDIDL